MNKKLGDNMMIGTDKSTPTVRPRALAWRAAAAVAICALCSPAWAENTLENIQFNAGDGGTVDITLTLSGPVGDVQAFTTDDPPRIAIDLPDTRNASDTRRVTVGAGATSAISAVEANGKTRVVVDLFRPAAFESRAEGNQFVLSVSAGNAGSASTVAGGADGSVDPAKRMPGATGISNLDFRRSDAGGGRVVVAFNSENIPADFEDDGEGIVVRFSGTDVPASLAQRLDVTDFATPVSNVELSSDSEGRAALRLTTSGEYEAMAYQTGTEYVVEVNPATKQDEQKVGLGVEEAVPVYSGTPVTFNFQNIPVRTVLQLIAEESGLNVVAADTVSGNVTLRLVNVPWDQAMDIVLRAKGLDKRRDGNVVWIAPQPELAAFEQAKADARLAMEDRAELITEYIPINYGNAEEIAKLLTEDAKRGSDVGGGGGSGGGVGGAGGASEVESAFLSKRGTVTADKRTNTLLLNDTAEKIREVRALLALLDRPVDQVLIEARIVVATETFARELGAKFGISAGYEDSNGNVLTSSGSSDSADRMANVGLSNRFGGQGSGLPVAAPGAIGGGILAPNIADRLNVNLPVDTPSGAIGFALLGADYLLDLELSALETEGRGEVVSSPRVITANQREAVIRQGDEVGYVTISASGGTGVPIPTVQFKPVLLELAVTPTITQDSRVYLVMKIVKDEIAGFVDTSIGSVPQISKREISTAVLMNNAQTVVVGGVYEFSSREDLNKVPFLGDVPVLGNLFRRKGKSTEKAELLVFVTPRVVPVSGK